MVLCRGLVWPCDWDLKKLLASLGIVVCSHVLNVPIHSLTVGFWVYTNCGVEGKTLCLGVWQSSIGIVEFIVGFWYGCISYYVVGSILLNHDELG